MKEKIINVVISAFVASLVAAIVVGLVGSNQSNLLGSTGTRYPNGLSTDSTSPSSGEVRTTTLTVTGTTSQTGTSTVAQSVDGIYVGGVLSFTATNTAQTLYTNTTGPKFCNLGNGYVRIKNNSSFAPSIRFSIGTSTATVATASMVATTTIATSTSYLIKPSAFTFILGQDESIVTVFDDNGDAQASTTYYGNRTAELGIPCQDLSLTF